QVVRDEDRRVLRTKVTARKGLEREEEREADLAALGHPTKPGLVREERELVGLKGDRPVVVTAEGGEEADLGGEPANEVLLAALDDPEHVLRARGGVRIRGRIRGRRSVAVVAASIRRGGRGGRGSRL